MSILMVLTSHDRLGDTGKKTGLWLEEFAAPYYIFRDESVKVTLASPKGGRPPVDPRSLEPQAQTEATKRFQADSEAQEAFANTAPLSTISAADYEGLFYPGGHGSPRTPIRSKSSKRSLLLASLLERCATGRRRSGIRSVPTARLSSKVNP